VRRALRVALLLLLAAAAQPVAAHLLNMTKVQVAVDAAGQVEVTLQVDLNRPAGGGEAYYTFSRLPEPLRDPALRVLLGRLAGAIQIDYGGARVALEPVAAQFPQETRERYLDPLNWPMTALTLRGRLPVTQTGGPPTGPPALLQGRLTADFRFEEPIALTFVRVPENRSLTRWLVADQLSPTFDPHAAPDTAAPADATPWWRYAAFGFTHILPKGLDHVLFVLGLYFGARNLRSLLLLVTGFTVAHSVTLGLASVGLVRLPAGIVEPLIALSIAWIGVENLVPRLREGRHRLLLVFGFGLLHGLGFASALSELQAPQGSFLLALLGFNVGIELGQIAVIALALLLTGAFLRRPAYGPWIARPASLLIACMGLAWTLERVIAT
jgi:hypothetical protein